MARMRTIKSLAELSTLVADQHAAGVDLYVRHSAGVAADRTMGCSTNHASGTAEAGISVNNLVSQLGDADARFVGNAVNEYRHFGTKCYILTGEIVGRGSDNEPVLDAETWTAVAYVDVDAIRTQREALCEHTHLDTGYGTDKETGRKIAFCRGCNARVLI